MTKLFLMTNFRFFEAAVYMSAEDLKLNDET